MKRCVFLNCLIVFFVFIAQPLTAGISQYSFETKLEDIRKKAHIVLNLYYSETKSISATIIDPGGTEWNAVANKVNGTNPVSTDMVFSIGSLSKTFTAACILDLIQKNILSLDTQLEQVLYNDEYPYNLENSSLISSVPPSLTIRQLLNHTSGIQEVLNDAYYLAVAEDVEAKWAPFPKEGQGPEIEKYILDYIDNEANPGSYDYCNTNYVLLGMIAENVSGMDLGTYVSLFLKPTQFDHTSMYDLECDHQQLTGWLENTVMVGVPDCWGLLSVTLPRAEGYKKVGSYWYLSSNFVGADAVALYSSSFGDGSMAATASDSARWVKKYYTYQVNLGIIDPVTNTYTNNDLVETNSTLTQFDLSYGYGIKRLTHKDSGYVLWGHTGTIGMGFKTVAFYMPELDVSLAMLFNEHDASYHYALDKLVDYVIDHID